MAFRGNKKRLGDMLIEEGLITDEQLGKALAVAKEKGKRIGETLVEIGFTTDDAIMHALSNQLHIGIVSLIGVRIPEEMMTLVNSSILRKNRMVPLGFFQGNMNIVEVAMADPMDMAAIDDFTIITNLQVEPVLALPNEIMVTLDRYFGDDENMEAAQKYADERRAIEEASQDDDYDENVNNSPIVKIVNSTIEQAARQRASDIHIEALERIVRIRFRIDGALYEKFTYDIHLLPAIIARLKIIGGMDISEKRKPQDGRITYIVDRVEYDIRASILPTVYGEKCVMRLAQKKMLTKDKSELGFTPEEMRQFENILKNPNGIILVTGPTGSGKSTTLYTALSELNKEDVNIITVEDPVEANIDGINQVQTNTKADLTFASALRSILRQDPDIIMIGEIRDTETAAIAVQASITGHLVVSTLHTNSSASTLTRLMDMGIESYLLADSMVGVIAQRLVRRLCPVCKKVHEADEEEKKLLGRPAYEPLTIYEPCGCDQCNNTGYKGRIGVYEIMTITPKIRHVISKRGTAEEIKDAALTEGMHTLRMSSSALVIQGVTSFSEMMKVSFDNDAG
ncbi:MAG: GspE/PulE family protein [Muribaculaceae bacterium]|nr:GspE/PulE family protein [Roseburia sp.]MCM1430504.1 GspE/PulE family protein [Muribaculaceae bacterium]MCM1493177.1 GspE/PulE family protein [Muribaculaceae bacterium]